jgi:hypothetical protein
MVKNHNKLREFLKKEPDSIVFASINEGLSEREWEVWIRGVLGDPVTERVGMGILSSTENEELRRKYVDTFKIPCGFTVIKSDLTLVMKQLFDILMAANAKGRRKFIRAIISENETNTTVNFSLNGNFVKGTIKDISVVGFSCFFDTDPGLTKNSLYQDIQIKLQTNLINTEGIVFGSRTDEKNTVYVILFTQRIDPGTQAKIRRYIQSNLQAKMDLELR